MVLNLENTLKLAQRFGYCYCRIEEAGSQLDEANVYATFAKDTTEDLVRELRDTLCLFGNGTYRLVFKNHKYSNGVNAEKAFMLSLSDSDKARPEAKQENGFMGFGSFQEMEQYRKQMAEDLAAQSKKLLREELARHKLEQERDKYKELWEDAEEEIKDYEKWVRDLIENKDNLKDEWADILAKGLGKLVNVLPLNKGSNNKPIDNSDQTQL